MRKIKKIYSVNLDKNIVEKFRKVCGESILSSTINFILYGVVDYVEQEKKKRKRKL